MRAILVAALVCTASLSGTATATDSASRRFSITGSATVTRDSPTLHGDKLSVRAALAPSNAAVSSSAVVQDGGQFTLMANAVAVPLVCYNDTIFRDDFDGDGG